MTDFVGKDGAGKDIKLIQYDGLTYPAGVTKLMETEHSLRKQLECCRDIGVRDDDVFIPAYVKSGMLSKSQSIFYATAVNGHNIVLTGQGGSGKTFVLQKVAKELCSRGQIVAVTCTTGIAATQFEKGQTLHSWCGLGDGGIQKSELSRLLVHDERYKKAKERIVTTDVLIIDECSMLSKKMFDNVEFLCRSVRGGDQYFGGIQVILSGDFYQLPPVPDQLYGETGEFCFQSNIFFNAIPHSIRLESIFRQKNDDMILCVNEVEKGTPSQQSLEFIKSLERNINVNEKTVYLFSTNFKTKLFNHDKLKAMPGDVKLYRAKDEGDKYYLNKFQAPAILGLKVNCPVMLVVNLSDMLVNGTRGTIKSMTDDFVTVHFSTPNKTINLSRHLFTKIDPVSRRTLSKRVQLPLVLSFGITIHKSQGMTLQSVVVDCTDAKIPGQIGVALGRATSAENLQVKHFRSSLLKEHPDTVKSFFKTESKSIMQDGSCCKNMFISKEIENDLFTPFDIDNIGYTDINSAVADEDNVDDTDDDDDDDDVFSMDEETSVIELEESSNIDEILSKQKPVPIPDDLDPINVINTVSAEYEGSPMGDSMKKLTEQIFKRFFPFYIWLSSHFLKLNQISDDNFVDAVKAEPKNVTKFCADVNAFLKSDAYVSSCQVLLSSYGTDIKREGQFFCNSLSFYLQNFVIQHKAKLIISVNVPERNVPTENSEVGKGNIRYIGGYCVSKLRYRYQKKIQSSLYDPKKEKHLNLCREKENLLSNLTISYSELSVTTEFEETLASTSRKQNVRHSLTNITDSTFLFFQSLTNKIRKFETFSNLHKYCQYVIELIRSEIFNDKALFKEWLNLFNVRHSDSDEDEGNESEDSLEIIVCNITELFNETVSKFVNVSASHFRKDYLLHVKREKGKAHRKKVMEKKEKKNTKKVSLTEIQSDKSDGKIVSHFKLKSGVIDDEQYFNDRYYTKRDLQKLCEAYEISVYSNQNKQFLNDQLVNVIKETDFMLTPRVFLNAELQPEAGPEEIIVCATVDRLVSEPESGTSKGGKRKGSSKGKAKQSKSSNKRKAKRRKSDDIEREEVNCCHVCLQAYDDSPDWICCDGCDKWVHGNCVGITTDAQWEELRNETVNFFCPFCE